MTMRNDIEALENMAATKSGSGRVTSMARAAFGARAAINRGENISWTLPFLCAFVVDVMDFVPFLGFLKVPFIVYLFIFNWGHGSVKMRFVRAIILFFDLIPIISILPLNLLVMVHTYNDVKRNAANAEENSDFLQEDARVKRANERRWEALQEAESV